MTKPEYTIKSLDAFEVEAPHNGGSGEWLETGRFTCASTGHVGNFQRSAPPDKAARQAAGAAVLQELYESPELLNEGLLSFEYPLFVAEDDELDYFLGRLVHRVGKAVGSAAKTVGKGLSTINKFAPVSLLTSGLSMTPIGMAVRAGLGAVQAVGEGRNAFQGAFRSLAATPGARFLVDTGMAAARGENIVKAAQKAFQAGVGDVRKSLQFAAMVAPFVPGVGTGVAAALGAANALASGQPISDALIAGVRGAIPGGAIAQLAFDTAVNLAKGKNISAALLNSARAQLPGGPAAQAAFDAAVTLAKGKSIQDAALAATGRLLPPSPYAADALAFVKKVASGQNIQRAALSSVGNLVLSRIERQAGPVFSSVRARLPGTPAALTARASQTLARARAAQRSPSQLFEIQALDEFESGTMESVGIENAETEGVEDAVFGETEEMEWAARLLEITDENELDGFLGSMVSRVTGGTLSPTESDPLRTLLCRVAKQALPMVGDAAAHPLAARADRTTGSKLTAIAGDLFGLELEGLSPEDQEFEVARRFVRFAGAGARRARRIRSTRTPSLAARRALTAAARNHAPGLLRRRRRGSRAATVVRAREPDLDPTFDTLSIDLAPPVEPAPPADPAPATDPAPTPEPDPADATASAAGEPLLPDNEPANSTEPQSQPPKKDNDMHDLDHTTMEINDEAENFEFEESQEYSGQGQGESLFNEDDEAEFAANLLEIHDEAELDHFIGALLSKARKALGSALKSPLLQPLGGFIKGAIKKVIPLAGGALGNIIAPGVGGMIGSRLASGASDLLGLELEGLAPEDQEFEVAKQLVRTVGTAVQNAAQSPVAATDPQAAAKAAMIAAARTYLPGLLQSAQPAGNGGGAGHHHHRAQSGRWYRRDRKIVLVGV